MGAGIEVPRTVFAHGMLLSGGKKMSKTLGNVLRPDELLRFFSADMVRYFILREVSFGQDGYISYEAITDRVNSDLADGLGNLASRTLTMVRNYFAGTPPRPSPDDEFAADVRERINEAKVRFDEEFRSLSFSRGLEAAWAGIARVDKFITENEPWKLAKDPASRGKLEAVLATAYEGLRHLVLLVAPAMPESARHIWRQMGLSGDPLAISPNGATWGEAIDVAKIEQISPAFPKLNKEKIMAEIEPQNDAAQMATQPADTTTQAAAPPTNIISIDDFIKVELRAATVLEAERVPKADKLLRLVIDVGEEKPRQILAGIAEHYTPEEVVGRKIIVVANLAPRKLRGLESNGMLLAASVGETGKPVLATFGEDVPNGTRLK
jgi:methionyl-tRNA synthetase